MELGSESRCRSGVRQQPSVATSVDEDVLQGGSVGRLCRFDDDEWLLGGMWMICIVTGCGFIQNSLGAVATSSGAIRRELPV